MLLCLLSFVVVVALFNFSSSVFAVFSLAQDAGQGQVQSVIVFCILFRIKCLLLSSSSRVTNFIVALLVILRIKMFCYGQLIFFFALFWLVFVLWLEIELA